jgi:hypothetical protein
MRRFLRCVHGCAFLMYDLAAIAIGLACFACAFGFLYVLERI